MGSEDGCISFCNAVTGRLVERVTRAHADWISGIVFLGDGTGVVSSSFDGTIKIWKWGNDNVASVLAKQSISSPGQGTGVEGLGALCTKVLEDNGVSGFIYLHRAIFWIFSTHSGADGRVGCRSARSHPWSSLKMEFGSSRVRLMVRCGYGILGMEGYISHSMHTTKLVRQFRDCSFFLDLTNSIPSSFVLVESIALSKAGDLLATASRDKTVRLCETISCAYPCFAYSQSLISSAGTVS